VLAVLVTVERGAGGEATLAFVAGFAAAVGIALWIAALARLRSRARAGAVRWPRERRASGG
jgi:ABC-type nickel/cobalt efflux system permease component RcnA